MSGEDVLAEAQNQLQREGNDEQSKGTAVFLTIRCSMVEKLEDECKRKNWKRGLEADGKSDTKVAMILPPLLQPTVCLVFALEENLLEDSARTVGAPKVVDLAAYRGKLLCGTGEGAQGVLESLKRSLQRRERKTREGRRLVRKVWDRRCECPPVLRANLIRHYESGEQLIDGEMLLYVRTQLTVA